MRPPHVRQRVMSSAKTRARSFAQPMRRGLGEDSAGSQGLSWPNVASRPSSLGAGKNWSRTRSRTRRARRGSGARSRFAALRFIAARALWTGDAGGRGQALTLADQALALLVQHAPEAKLRAEALAWLRPRRPSTLQKILR